MVGKQLNMYLKGKDPCDSDSTSFREHCFGERHKSIVYWFNNNLYSKYGSIVGWIRCMEQQQYGRRNGQLIRRCHCSFRRYLQYCLHHHGWMYGNKDSTAIDHSGCTACIACHHWYHNCLRGCHHNTGKYNKRRHLEQCFNR